MSIFFDNDNYYSISMKYYIFNRLKAELAMKKKCIIFHNSANKDFVCYYCKTKRLLEKKLFYKQLDNVDNCIDLIDIINNNMDKYLLFCENTLDMSLYD